ncbi:hypothetical protein [Rhodococcus jostii]|uniref:hypothetical protein n=1 Tax=Rhodococcus jostii TaxID=132919 RepID=UPI0013C37412|nr:hypothetical protein [Rhodococcus jostii]
MNDAFPHPHRRRIAAQCTLAGAGFFVRGPDGNHRLPTSFRISLCTMAHGRP